MDESGVALFCCDMLVCVPSVGVLTEETVGLCWKPC